MDDNGKFMSRSIDSYQRTETPALERPRTTFTNNLTNDNFTLERDFKLEVLNWLNDGKPKLFRSAAEGNYLVRLMSVSLTPEERLGRMLHTFNATAYEMAPCTAKSLLEHDIIKGFIKMLGSLNHKVVQMTTDIKTVFVPNALKVRVLEAKPGQKIKFTLANGSTIDITIGNTGYYELPIDESNLLI
jgi:hypothetical protein